MIVGNSIKVRLARRGQTQQWLAGKVGVKREYMNRIIRGKIQPGVGLAIRISRALGAPVEKVFVLIPPNSIPASINDAGGAGI